MTVDFENAVRKVLEHFMNAGFDQIGMIAGQEEPLTKLALSVTSFGKLSAISI